MYSKKNIEIIPTVLMLDTEERLLQVTKKYFSNRQIILIPVKTLQDAWKQLKKNLPDCIIVDVSMMENKGQLFIERLKKNKYFQHVPWICLTAKGLTDDRIKGYTLGCSAYISKPFDPEELESIIKNIIYHTQISVEFALKSYLLLKDIRVSLTKHYDDFLTSNRRIHLTIKEQIVLKKFLMGKKIPEIASNLNVSNRSVEKYLSKLLDKTNTKNSLELLSLPWDTLLNDKRANDGNRTRE